MMRVVSREQTPFIKRIKEGPCHGHTLDKSIDKKTYGAGGGCV